MLQTFKNAWKVRELRNKILFTLMIILLYRIGATLFVPFVDVTLLDNMSTIMSGSIFQFLNTLSGNAFKNGTFFALSVSPYITASIVMQLLTIALPPLERLSKQGEEGKKKIAAYTRIVTVALALLTSWGYVELLNSSGALVVSKLDGNFYYFQLAVMMACFCAGASLVMWLAEKINDHGIGNGISIILFANIISDASTQVGQMKSMLQTTQPIEINGFTYGYETVYMTGWPLALGILKVVLSVALAILAVGLIVWFTNSERRIPIQYAKRVVGRKMYGGQSSNLPLKMNMAGVMPVIFASSIVSLPATVANFFTKENWFTKFVNNWFSYTSIAYIVVFMILLFAFSYFYIMISFNPIEVANNIRSNGGSIPGIRPGKPTSDYIKKVLNRVTLVGAVFLGVIAGVPMIANAIFVKFNISFATIAFTGTSLLIVVGVALETVRELEAQLSMRNYKGFLD